MTHNREPGSEGWFTDRNVTLDMAGLSDDEREQGSVWMGGGSQQFVTPEDEVDYSKVSCVVFRWGDPKVEDVFAALLEHDDTKGTVYFPFTPVAIIGHDAWLLALQDRDFDPTTAYRRTDHYVVLPFNVIAGELQLREFLARPTPRPELLGKVGTRWVAFELSTSIR